MISQYDAALAGSLLGWTIYGPNQQEFPGLYVVRAWMVGGVHKWPFIQKPADFESNHLVLAYAACLCRNLDEARRCIGPEFTYLARDEHDDPAVVESWV